jgi:hypothetical protein
MTGKGDPDQERDGTGGGPQTDEGAASRAAEVNAGR